MNRLIQPLQFSQFLRSPFDVSVCYIKIRYLIKKVANQWPRPKSSLESLVIQHLTLNPQSTEQNDPRWMLIPNKEIISQSCKIRSCSRFQKFSAHKQVPMRNQIGSLIKNFVPYHIELKIAPDRPVFKFFICKMLEVSASPNNGKHFLSDPM